MTRSGLVTLAAILGAGEGAPAEVPDQLDAGDWDAVLSVAGPTALMPALWRPARSLGLVAPVPGPLVEALGDRATPRHHPAAVLELAHRRNAARTADLLDQLATVVDELAASGIEVVALKGAAHLVGGTWPDPAERSMSDLDLLIDPGAARAASRRLERLGYVASDHPGEALGGHHHLPPLRHPDRFGSIELHVEPLQRGWRAALGAAELWTDAEVVSWRGRRLGVPTGAHAAVICLVHGYLADGAHYEAQVPLRTVHELWCAERRAGGEATSGPVGRIDWGEVDARLEAIGWTSLLDDHRATVERLFGDRVGSSGRRGGAAAARARLALALALDERPGAALAADRWLRARSSLDEGRLRRHYGTAIEGRWPLRLHHLSRQLPGRRRAPAGLDAVSADPTPRRRPRALLVTPELPSDTGNGLAMRADVALQALTAVADVTLVVIDRPLAAAGPDAASTRRRPPMGRPTDGRAELEATVERQVERLIRYRPQPVDDPTVAASWLADEAARTRLGALAPLAGAARLGHPAAVADLAAELFEPPTEADAEEEAEAEAAAPRPAPAPPFDLVHVVRLRMAPWAEAFGFRPDVVTVLDLDDDEVTTHARLCATAEQRGEPELAEHLAGEAAALGRLADWYAPRASVVTVASPDDVAGVARHQPGQVEVVPNAVGARPIWRRRPTEPATDAGGSGPRLLLVANFTYSPNRWAAEILVDDLLPALGVRVGGPVHVDLVGRAPASFERFRSHPGVRVAGHVASAIALDRAYAAAALVVLPLPPAGGTRIKVLEAFARRVPVVATPGAVEGLGVVDGVHALVADGLDDLVEACARTLADPSASRARAERAAHLAAAFDRRVVVGQLSGRFAHWLATRDGPGAYRL